ncbi:MAG: hypothetical protein GX628_08335 [Clostridiales bacterium]|nr:hypothetical protein [Clostridiales bacterium]
MKKALVIAITVILAITMMIPSAALDWYKDKIENCFDKMPAVLEGATKVALAATWEEGKTDARHGTSDKFDYIYLKKDGKGDYSVKFTVAEEGLYEFGFRLMGWTKSVLRSTNVRIDDAKNVYIAYDYVEADQHHDHYWYGISAVLKAGEHTVTLSLADDFDDSKVKSLYFADFYYAKGELPVETTAAAAAADTAAADAPADKPAAKAPATFDFAMVGLAALALSAGGLVISKKRK